MSTILAPEQPIAAPPQTMPTTPAAAPSVGARPTIVANRKLLVKRFASLGFTVSTGGGLPYWEVLLFTDRSLIDPANASRRTPVNFYSSRQESGLRRAPASGDDVFLVPSAVLRGFSAATPKPTAIYYTVAVYATPDGGSPMLPQPPEQLAVSAPFVSVSPDFTPDAVGQVLGVPSGRLRVVAQALDVAPSPASPAPAAAPGPATPPVDTAAAVSPVAPVPAAPAPVAATPGTTAAPGTVAPAPPPAVATTPVDAASDAAAGEDGYAFYAAHPEQMNGGVPAPAAIAGAPSPAPAAAPPAPAPVAQQPSAAPVADEPYDDGYGEYDDGWSAQPASWGGELEAPFPRGFPEPAPLVGEDGYGWSSTPPYELEGVATRYPYRGLDEPDAPPAGNGANVTTPPPPDAPVATSGGTVAQPAPATAPAPAPAVAPAPVAGTPVAGAPVGAAPPGQLALTIDDKRALIEKVAGAESGSERYGAINADGEYKGRFGPSHAAYHHHHIGLSYGIVQFTQESGNLGRLLQMMRDRDEATFGQIFGEHAAELLRVTTADGPPASESPEGRSARTQPVDGADLWEEPWLGRFRQAGSVAAFQSAQNELAAATFVDPMLRFAGDLGLDTDRALAMVVDRAVQMGVQGARHWIIAAVGPVSTPALRQQALTAVGASDLASFQAASGLDVDTLWGPVSHAALVGALRRLGGASPIPLPTVDQMLDAMVRRAEGDNALWAGRVARLRTADVFTDQPYAG
jgi:hypothetical protein